MGAERMVCMGAERMVCMGAERIWCAWVQRGYGVHGAPGHLTRKTRQHRCAKYSAIPALHKAMKRSQVNSFISIDLCKGGAHTIPHLTSKFDDVIP